MSQPALPPPARRAQAPDVTAPDGSEIRLLVDARHSASHASMVDVTLPAGQVSRPVWHRTVEEIWYILEGRGKVWRCPPDASAAEYPPVEVVPGRRPRHPDGLAFPVQRRQRCAPPLPLLHLPALARRRRSPSGGGRRLGGRDGVIRVICYA